MPTDMIQEIIELKGSLAVAVATKELVASSVKIFGFQVQFTRLPSPTTKSKAIGKARSLGLSMIPDVFVDSGVENLNWQYPFHLPAPNVLIQRWNN
jgi:hypothetical protein